MQVGNLHFPAQFHDAHLLGRGYAVRLCLKDQIPFDESTGSFSARYGCVSHHHGNGKLLNT